MNYVSNEKELVDVYKRQLIDRLLSQLDSLNLERIILIIHLVLSLVRSLKRLPMPAARMIACIIN